MVVILTYASAFKSAAVWRELEVFMQDFFAAPFTGLIFQGNQNYLSRCLDVDRKGPDIPFFSKLMIKYLRAFTEFYSIAVKRRRNC